ncbi:unnamed protein product [Calypogeia fissa]
MDELVVTVLQARQLLIKDISGSSDPYVVLKLGDSTEKTKVIKRNLNPEWNETFSLVVKDPATDSLEISIYDWDKVGARDKLGVQVISLKDLNPNIRQTVTLSLLKNYNRDDPKNYNKNRGQITLELEYKQVDGNKGDSKEPQEELTEEAKTTATLESVEDAKDAELETPTEELKQDDTSASETILPRESSEATSASEGRDVEHTTPHIEVEREDATDGATLDSESAGDNPIEPTREPAECVVEHDDEVNEEYLPNETPLTDSSEGVPPVDGEDVETPTSHKEPAQGETTDEVVHSTVIGESLVVEQGEERKPDAGDEEVHEDNVAEAEPLTDSAEAVPQVEDTDEEAQASYEELGKGEITDDVAQSSKIGEAIVEDVKDKELDVGDGEKNVAEEETLPTGSAEAIPLVEGEGLTSHEETAQGETTDDVAKWPEESESIVGEEVKDIEPNIGDEEVNEQEHVAEETLPVDSAEAVRQIEGKDNEAPVSDEEVGQMETPDEVAESSELRDAIVGEDSKDGEHQAGEEGVREENVAEGTPPPDSAEAIPVVEGKDFEAPTSHEEVDQGETADEVSQSPEIGEASVVEDSKDGEPGAGDDEVNEGENAAEETPLMDSAEAIPLEEGKDFEAPTSHEEVDQGERATEASQSPEIGESIVVEDSKDEEPGAGHEEVNEGENAAEETPMDSAEDIPLVEGKDFEAPISHEEVEQGETTDEAPQSEEIGEASVVEDSKDGEPGAGDEEVNEGENVAEETPLMDSAEGIPLVDGKDFEAPTYHEEVDHGERAAEASQSPEIGESIVVEDSKDEEPGAGDEEVDERENVAEEAPLMDSAEAIALAEDKEVETPISNEEVEQGETANEVAHSPEIGESIVVEDSRNEEPGAGDEEVNVGENVAEEIPLDSVGAIPLVEGKHVEAPEDLTDAIPDAKDEEVEPHTILEVLGNEEATGEVAEHPGSGATLDENSKDGEPVIGENGDGKEESVADEKLLTTDVTDASVTVEDRDFEAPRQHEELAKEEAGADDSGAAIASGEATVGIDDGVAEASASQQELSETPTSHEEAQEEHMATNETAVHEEASESAVPAEDIKPDVLAATPETIDAIPVENDETVNHKEESELAGPDADIQLNELESAPESVEQAPEESVETMNHQDRELVIDEKEESANIISAGEDSDVDAPTTDGELAKGETTGQGTESEESSEAPLIDNAKEEESLIVDEDLNKELSVMEKVDSAADFAETIPAAEEKHPAAPTSFEEVPKEENAFDVSPSLESVEATDVIPAVEDKDVETPIPQEELSKETVTEDLARASQGGEAIAAEDAKDEELASGHEDLVEDKEVEAPNSLEEVAREDTGECESALVAKTGGVFPASEDTSVEHVTPTIETKDIEVPASHEQLAEEDTISRELSSEPEFPAATPSEDNNIVEPATGEELTEEKSLAGGGSSTTDSAEPVGSLELQHEESPTPREEPDGVNRVTDEVLSSSSEVADPVVEPATASNELISSNHANMAEMVAKTARDLDPSFLHEVEKVHNVSEDSEDDKTSVPLSTHTADLSSSWVNVTPIQYAEGQSASDVSNLKNLSERPDDDLASGGDGWRIVSEQDISALGVPKSKMQDGETGSAGFKFPFSIVLWCSQSMTNLFGGNQKES